MKEIMVRAWEIATEGQEKFGGSKIEYIAEALKQAWAESKQQPEQMELSDEIKESFLDNRTDVIYLIHSNSQPCYLAKIKGTHPTYKLDREFIDWKMSGRAREYEVEENQLYEMKESRERFYFMVVDGIIYEYNYNQVLDLVK